MSQEEVDNDRNQHDDEETSPKGKQELRDVPLKSALKAFVVDQIQKFYSVAGMRALISPKSKGEIWEIRQVLEQKLSEDKHIVGFFSCATSLRTKVDGEIKHVPGISFWVIFDWPECGLSAYENYLSKLVINAKLDLLCCNSVRGRSKYLFLLHLKLNKMLLKD